MDKQECKTTLNIERLETSWNAQFVSRFHTVASLNPKQTVGSHSYGVAILVNELWADASKELLQKALYHDVPEVMLGDIPFTAKRNHPEIGDAFKIAEIAVIHEYELKWLYANLSIKDEERLKMADMLDLVLYTHLEGQTNKEMADICKFGAHYLYYNFGDRVGGDFEPVRDVLRHKGIKYDKEWFDTRREQFEQVGAM